MGELIQSAPHVEDVWDFLSCMVMLLLMFSCGISVHLTDKYVMGGLAALLLLMKVKGAIRGIHLSKIKFMLEKFMFLKFFSFG
ncbi:hypothetical protein P8452_78090 [Trifolium repens]|nr:hypothetical protein P8452_78090 [Trifolium repens]